MSGSAATTNAPANPGPNAAGGGAEDENALPTIADDLVVTKYKMAAEITNRE